MNSFKHNLLVSWQLVARDIRVIILDRLKDDLINTGITVFFFNFVFGSLAPLIGIDKTLVASTFLGTVVGSFLFICFSRAINDLADRTFHKFIDYRRTLPLSNRWFLLAQIVSYTLHCLCTSVPILIIGKFILGSRLDISNANWLIFFAMYLGVMLLISAFFACLVYGVSFQWFKFNIWQRLLTPIHLLGCLFYPWSKAYAFSPLFAQLLLLNPMTYCIEGLRSSLLNGHHFLSMWLCLLMVFVLIIVVISFLLTVILKRLDWV